MRSSFNGQQNNNNNKHYHTLLHNSATTMGDSRRRSSYFEPAFAQLERKSRASLLAPTSQTDEEGAQARDVVFEVGETSTLASGMNLVTTMVGAGVLSFPGLFAKGGWIVSPIVLGGSAMALCEIGDVISQVLDWCEQRGYKYPKAYSFGSRPEKYEDMMEVPFGSTGKTITFFAFNAFMVLVSGAYMILIGTSVEYIVRHEYFPYRACVLLMSLIYGPLTLLDNMSLISRMSSIGVVASVMYVVCIACAGLSADRKKVSYDIEWSKIFGGLGQLIAVMLMGFTYQVVVPTVRSEMSQPGDLRTAIYGSIALVTGIYGVAGATGYLGYGQNVEGNVLKNMITVSDPAAPLPVKNPTWPGVFWYHLLASLCAYHASDALGCILEVTRGRQ
mmetsp:Transcript_13065/g.28604  ORF Transcript_13065/g.28604 Transcript_13065/m.28604 type:complete len:389 (+) Transcript_13065:971-2137(+)